MTAENESAAVRWPEPVLPRWSAIPRTTVPQFAARTLRDGAGGPALIFDDGVEIGCDQLIEEAERLADGLARRLLPGDRVALAIGNRAEFFVALLALAAVRAVAVTMSPAIGDHDALHMLSDAGCVMALVDDQAAATIGPLRSRLPVLREIVPLRGAEPSGLSQLHGSGRMALDALDAPVEEIFEIGYTSGTTGLPKALAGDHADTLTYVDDMLRIVGFGPGDRILSPLQFHYGDPIWMLFMSWAVGSPLIAMRRFSVSRFWSVARDHGATHICTIGAIPNLLLTPDPSPAERDHRVRQALAVGIPASRHRELIDRFGVQWLEVYGSSEAGTIMVMPPALADAYVGSGAIGIPAPHVTVRLVDEDGTAIVGEGVGEAEIGGDLHFGGYLGNPQATDEVLHDGWLRTGDLLRRDADGMHYFVGRRKELIRRGGENIAPAEVEAVLRLHPAVIDAAVVPVADPLRGEEAKAYVELRSGSPFDPAGLVAFCAQRLAAFKVPRYVEQRAEPFPRTASQRIPKERLKVDGEHLTSTAWDVSRR
jgi:crotonobetaine/carnitine-CoA ligase